MFLTLEKKPFKKGFLQNFAMIYVQVLSLCTTIIYMWNRTHWAGATLNSDTFPAKKTLNAINSICSKHSYKKRKGSLKTRAVLLIFLFEIEISGVVIEKILQNIKDRYFHCFSEEFLSENNFETVLASFYCYKYNTNTSKAVEKIATY